MKPELWKQLRDEANDVKDCFTRFSFQGLAFAAVLLTAAAGYQDAEQPFIGLSGLLAIVVMMTVSRIGTYKYGTANRHFAFERLDDSTEGGLSVGWEEALRAWRVMAPALFDRIYVSKQDRFVRDQWLGWNLEQLERSMKARPETPSWGHQGASGGLGEIKDDSARRFWFEPGSQLSPVSWHPGRYLQEMQNVLHFVAWLALMPVLGMAFQLSTPPLALLSSVFSREPAVVSSDYIGIVLGVLAWIAVVISLWYLLFRARQLRARRSILESGMLSIPASAVVWEAAIRAHHLAARWTENDPDLYMRR